MTPAGWFVMLASVGGVTLLFAWCMSRVLWGPKPPNPDQLHGPLDIDTGDRDDRE